MHGKSRVARNTCISALSVSVSVALCKLWKLRIHWQGCRKRGTLSSTVCLLASDCEVLVTTSAFSYSG